MELQALVIGVYPDGPNQVRVTVGRHGMESGYTPVLEVHNVAWSDRKDVVEEVYWTCVRDELIELLGRRLAVGVLF